LARDKQLLHLGAWVLGVALCVSLLVGILVFYPLTRRLRHLSAEVEKFREHDFKTFTEISVAPVQDELSQLEANITLMSAQIVRQLSRISTQARRRRDLFSRLSHDLRTPLATLQLKAAELSAGKRDAYLARALQFSVRLKDLVDELFEMAKLDTFQTVPVTKAFSLPELVQDVLQQFEATAQQAEVKLQMTGETALPFVDGDISLMQRVFENMIAMPCAMSRRGIRLLFSCS